MINVRLATANDRNAALRLVSSLLAELGGVPPSADAMAPVFDDLVSGGDAGFIAIGTDDAGAAVAVCTVSFLTALRTRGRYAIIQEMFVVPDARRSGAGMAVLRFALEHAAANGCGIVELGAPANGQRQIAFYRRAGFTEVGARLQYVRLDFRQGLPEAFQQELRPVSGRESGPQPVDADAPLVVDPGGGVGPEPLESPPRRRGQGSGQERDVGARPGLEERQVVFLVPQTFLIAGGDVGDPHHRAPRRSGRMPRAPRKAGRPSRSADCIRSMVLTTETACRPPLTGSAPFRMQSRK